MKRRFLFMLMAALTCIGANAALKRSNNYLRVLLQQQVRQ